MENCAKELAPGIWHLELPIPNYIICNVYLIEGNGLTLIDSGFPVESNMDILKHQLTKMGYEMTDVKRIIYTHHHVDHTGGGMLFSQSYQVKHLIADTVAARFRDVDKLIDSNRYIPEVLARDYSQFESIINPKEKMPLYHDMHPKFSPLVGKIEAYSDGNTIALGSRKLRAIAVPGHSPNDHMLLDENEGILFTGDFLLNGSTNFTYTDNANVGDYLQSLDKVDGMGLEVKLILPGHGELLYNHLGTVTENARQGVLSRCEKLVQFVRERGTCTAFEIYQALHPKLLKYPTWPGTFVDLICYLRYLVEVGQLKEKSCEAGTYTAS